MGNGIRIWGIVFLTNSSPEGIFDVPRPMGADMNLIFVWLLISFICTGVVLLCVRSAPYLDDEPLDMFKGAEEPTPDEDELGVEPRSTSPIQVRKIHPTPKGRSAPPRPKLASFAIFRTEEPLS